MTAIFDLIETDAWPSIRARVMSERDRRIQGLLYVASLEAMRKEQGFVEALDWVLEEGKPKPQRRTVEED